MLRDELMLSVLRQLRGILEHGLWVKSPRDPEKFELRGNAFALDLPIVCFTEWSLGESLPHMAEQGRIGLSFPKRWMIERGGLLRPWLEDAGLVLFPRKRLASNAIAPGM